jgi:hypothetical protein
MTNLAKTPYSLARQQRLATQKNPVPKAAPKGGGSIEIIGPGVEDKTPSESFKNAFRDLSQKRKKA